MRLSETSPKWPLAMTVTQLIGDESVSVRLIITRCTSGHILDVTTPVSTISEVNASSQENRPPFGHLSIRIASRTLLSERKVTCRSKRSDYREKNFVLKLTK